MASPSKELHICIGDSLLELEEDNGYRLPSYMQTALEEQTFKLFTQAECLEDPELLAKTHVYFGSQWDSKLLLELIPQRKLPIKLFAIFGVGYELAVDPINKLREDGYSIRMCNSPGLEETCADMAMLLMLASARQLLKGQTLLQEVMS